MIRGRSVAPSRDQARLVDSRHLRVGALEPSLPGDVARLAAVSQPVDRELLDRVRTAQQHRRRLIRRLVAGGWCAGAAIMPAWPVGTAIQIASRTAAGPARHVQHGDHGLSIIASARIKASPAVARSKVVGRDANLRRRGPAVIDWGWAPSLIAACQPCWGTSTPN